MSVDEAITAAWNEVIRDFDRACEEGMAVFWNEETLRLHFFRHLLQQNVSIAWFLAEHKIYVEGNEYRPDLIVAFRVNNGIERCVFEFKFWGHLKEWRETWSKLLKCRKTLWFDRAYFMAIGPTGRSKEFTITEEAKGWLRVMIHEKTWKETFLLNWAFLARDMLKRVLDMSFHELGLEFIVVQGEKYRIIFDSRSTSKVLIILVFPGLVPGSKQWEELKQRLTSAGFDKYIVFNKNFIAKFTGEFRNAVLIDEFDNTFPETVERIKRRLRQLKHVLADFKPPLKVKE